MWRLPQAEVPRQPAAEGADDQGGAAAPPSEASQSVLPILGAVARRPPSAASAAAARLAALRALGAAAPLCACLGAAVALLQHRGGECAGRAPLLPGAQGFGNAGKGVSKSTTSF